MGDKAAVLVIESAYMSRGLETLATFPGLRPMYVIGPHTSDEYVGRLVNRLRDGDTRLKLTGPCPHWVPAVAEEQERLTAEWEAGCGRPPQEGDRIAIQHTLIGTTVGLTDRFIYEDGKWIATEEPRRG